MDMLGTLMGDALRFAPQAGRVYENAKASWSAQGPWDAELIDWVHSEAQRFIDEGLLDPPHQAHVHNLRAGQLWGLGRFEEAALEQQVMISVRSKMPYSQRSIDADRKALQLMLEHRSPLDMLD